MSYLRSNSLGAAPGAVSADVTINYHMEGSVAVPNDRATLDAFYSLQYQLDRVAFALRAGDVVRSRMGMASVTPPSPITVDGTIGPQTAAMCSTLLNGSGGGDPASVAEMAANYAVDAQAIADKVGVSSVIDYPKSVKPPSFGPSLAAQTIVPHEQAKTQIGGSIFDVVKNLSTTSILLLGAAAIAGIYYATKK
jgi:hypothetical protein